MVCTPLNLHENNKTGLLQLYKNKGRQFQPESTVQIETFELDKLQIRSQYLGKFACFVPFIRKISYGKIKAIKF